MVGLWDVYRLVSNAVAVEYLVDSTSITPYACVYIYIQTIYIYIVVFFLIIIVFNYYSYS